MSARRSPPKRNPTITPENVAINAADPLPASGPGKGSARSRLTPRNSMANEDAAAPKETPYNTLRQLANMPPRPATPLRRASSAGPPSTRRSMRPTPGAQERTPGGMTLPGSTRRPNALTPHARVAEREFELRRAAAITPGKDRRRSGRQQQRETPRDGLRALSRLLAPSTMHIQRSPQNEELSTWKILVAGGDDLDDRPEPRPRLSMPLDEDEDDSLLLPPMRSAGLVEDDNLTQRSVELPRRVSLGYMAPRRSLGSFGSVRTSDRIGDVNELGLDALAADGNDSTFMQQDNFDDYEATNIEEVTSNLRSPYLDDGPGRISLASGRTSDIRPEAIPEDEAETTFVLPLPQRDSLPGRPSTAGLNESDEENDDDNDLGEQLADPEDPEDETMIDPTVVQSEKAIRDGKKSQKIKKRIKISRYGIQYPSLPVGVVKRLATTFLKTCGNGNTKLSKDTLEAIMQASDWFFEQVSEDLGTYAQHAGRKTIDENDVVTLMKR